ncbi:hypothetical protein [Bacillus sp. 123MFChir2]|uniref:hypothetical protein n=1 Tax=Bacillus sp. 123MFChir2 TaxID=1169144 RepID=UPI00036B108A|nr:hypothetical protein [Bacillus sp. 123MFChir2]
MSRIVKQTGPTCGIYAFINGINNINSDKKISKEKADKLLYQLLDNNLIKERRNGITGITFVGEFFDFELFVQFLKVNIDNFKENISYRNIKYSINIKNINYLENDSVIEEIRSKKSFVLFSIAAPLKARELLPALKGYRVSHWVTICDYDDEKFKFIITDSAGGKIKRYSFEELRKQNNKLKGKKFYWANYKRDKRSTSKKDKIEQLLEKQLKNKNDFLNKKILKDTINHTAGKIIIVQKIEG